MVVIQPTQISLEKGAVVLTNTELNVVLHALKVAHADLLAHGGRFYGPSYGPTMTLGKLCELITQLEEYRDQRAKQRGD